MGRTLKDGASRLTRILFVLMAVCALVPCEALSLEKRIRNSLGMEFVLIPAGTFIMGSPSGEAHRNPKELQHKVTITRPFYMQTTEVTLKQWRALMKRRFLGRRRGKGNMPVTKVSWYDCMKFIKKLNTLNEGSYRLPTEAEWEYACRAGSRTAYSWGETIDCTRAMYGNSYGNNQCMDHIRAMGLANNGPAPVKSFPPNAWGLYDMHGNVWEWCQDWYGDYPSGPVVDPKGPNSGDEKVRRGGSWFKYGYSCRSANRAFGRPPTRYTTTGFRLVRDAE